MNRVEWSLTYWFSRTSLFTRPSILRLAVEVNCLSYLMCIGPCIVVINEEEKPTRCYLVFYYTYDRLNMFRAPLQLKPGHLASLPAPNHQPSATQESDGPCGNQWYSRELLMMGIVVPETCWAYHKCNKTLSSIYLVLLHLCLSYCCNTVIKE
jgi:hypothetical protein